MTAPSKSAKMYRWDDANAPVLSGTRGSLIALIKACLIDGYEGKAIPGGWAMPFVSADNQKAAFRLSFTHGTGKYLVVDEKTSASAYSPTIQGFESMTDVDTGLGGFPEDAYVASSSYGSATRKGIFISGSADSTPRPWIIVANEVFLWVYVWPGVASTDAPEVSDYFSSFTFGDFYTLVTGDHHNTLLCISAPTSGSSVVSTSGTIGHYAAGAYGSHSHYRYGYAALSSSNGSIVFPRSAKGVGPAYKMPALLSAGPNGGTNNSYSNLHVCTHQAHGMYGPAYSSDDPVILTKPIIPQENLTSRGYVPGLRVPYAYRPFQPSQIVVDPDTQEKFVCLGGRGYYDYPIFLVSIDNFWE